MFYIDNIDWFQEVPDEKKYIKLFPDEHFSKKSTRILTYKVKN